MNTFTIDIIEKCKQNDRKAQLQLYNQYCNGMFVVANRFVKDTLEAEDIVQESFIKAFAKLHQYKAEVTFGDDWSSKGDFHNYYIKEFVKAPSFGDSRIPEIDMSRFKTLTVGVDRFRVGKMELLSVTDRKTPTLWLYDHVVNRAMIKNKTLKKRKLNEIEMKKFKQLKDGKTFVTAKEGGAQILMGVLRAEVGCIRCHEDYEKGDLMGAFKYTLIPAGTGLHKIKAIPVKEPVKKPVKKTPVKKRELG